MEHILSNRSGHPAMKNTDIQGEFSGWRVIEDIGTGDGVPTKCELYDKPGRPRQQFQHMDVAVCCICADECHDKLRMKGVWHVGVRDFSLIGWKIAILTESP